ncbi:hypothetical protein [Halovivax sp.]|uniref:hypothetical protein n=1 Tax=Halovivax sp. TaxID=1935978 RepID=UPI0025BF23E9|nr:hypothetical protein [Halovivax sp.]
MADAHDEPAGREEPSVPTGEPSDGEAPTDSSELHVDRRTVLRNAAGAGYALGVAHVLGVDDYLTASGGTVTVDAALVRPDPDDPSTVERRTREVPARWHAAVSAALEVHARLTRLSIPGYVNSAVVPGSYDDGSARISIGFRDGDMRSLPSDLAGLLPRIDLDWDGSFDDVSLQVEGVDALDHFETDLDEDAEPHLVPYPNIDPVPGGVRCETRDSYATVTPALYHPEADEPTFATALHAYAGDSAIGAPLRLPANRTTSRPEIGYVTDELPDADVAVARSTDEFTPGSELDVVDPIPVAGQYTLWGLADLIARGEYVEKMGGTTGRTQGRIHGVDAATCVTADSCRRGQLRWGTEADMSDGDSGSVTYHPDPDLADGALIASINSARTWWPGQDHVWGIAAHALTDEHGYHF